MNLYASRATWAYVICPLLPLVLLFNLRGILAVGFQSSGMSFQHVEHSWFLWLIETWVGEGRGWVGGEACAAGGEQDKPQRSGWCFWSLKDTTLRLPWRAHSRAVCVQVPIPRRSIFWVFVHSRIYCFIPLTHTWMLPQTKSLSAYQRWNLQIFKVGAYIPGGTRFPVLCSLLINFL